MKVETTKWDKDQNTSSTTDHSQFLIQGIARKRWAKSLEKVLDETKAIDWVRLSDQVVAGCRTGLEQQLYWKLLHRRLTVNSYIKSANPNDHLCPGCGREVETIEHWLWDCPRSKAFWLHFYKTVLEWLGLDHSWIPSYQAICAEIFLFFPGFEGLLSNEEWILLHVSHSTALYALWSCRDEPNKSPVLLERMWHSRLESRVFLLQQQSVLKQG
ncbi:hypothetical protein HDU91_003646, partial [Kappamyces sp. JEL0680]